MTSERVIVNGDWPVTEAGPLTALEFLASHTGLPKGRIKDAMGKGAVWFTHKGQEKRLRRVQQTLLPGDRLAIAYDSQILSTTVPDPVLVADLRDYSVWDKPAGMLSQGTRQGDHLCLLRWLEKSGLPKRQHWLVHRLDREASGLMLVAHTRKAVAALSALFQSRDLDKRYEVEVWLDLAGRQRVSQPEGLRIALPLDGKASASQVRLLAAAADGTPDHLDVRIETGRKHQIRRHLAAQGWPVLGDPEYGNAASKDLRGLRLRAVSLAFRCPLSGQARLFVLPGLRDAV